MPVRYRIDVPQRVVFSTITGNTNFAEMMEHQKSLSTDPAFSPTLNQLVDARAAESYSSTTTDLQLLAEQNIFGEGSRRAIVVSKDVHYGMARMFEMMRQGDDEIMVFRDLDQAREWLGLEGADT